MQPPIRSDQRMTRGLQSCDAQLLAHPDAQSHELVSTADVLHVSVSERRSRAGTRAVGLKRAAQVIAPLVTATSEWFADDEYIERQTFAPSAGARHPLTALILNRDTPDAEHSAWAVSASVAPTLFEITNHDSHRQALLAAVTSAVRLPTHPGTVIVALARFRRTLSKYADGSSLVWRDAGVFLGYAHLMAHQFGLDSTLAGAAGTTAFALPDSDDTLVDVGSIVLSEPEHAP